LQNDEGRGAFSAVKTIGPFCLSLLASLATFLAILGGFGHPNRLKLLKTPPKLQGEMQHRKRREWSSCITQSRSMIFSYLLRSRHKYPANGTINTVQSH